MPGAFDYFLRNVSREAGPALAGLNRGKQAAFDQEQELRQQALREALLKEQQTQALRDRSDRMGDAVRAEGRFTKQLEEQRAAREQERQDAIGQRRDLSLQRDVESERDRRHQIALENLRRTPSERDRYLQSQANQRDATGSASSGPTESQQNKEVDRLQQRYQTNPIVKNAYGFASAIPDIRVGLGQNSGAGDLQAVYGLVKMFDPNSVVREGEIKLTQSASSLPSRVRLLWENANQGRLLSPQQRAEIEALLDEQIGARERLVAPVQAQFGAQARERGVSADSAFIAPSPFEGIKPGGTNKPPGGVNPQSLPPLSAEEKELASRDPKFRAFLQSKGYVF
jgi:hypothetical protein